MAVALSLDLEQRFHGRHNLFGCDAHFRFERWREGNWDSRRPEAPGGFDAKSTWSRLASGHLTLFMAVPTIYERLIATWSEADKATRAMWSVKRVLVFTAIGASGTRVKVLLKRPRSI